MGRQFWREFPIVMIVLLGGVNPAGSFSLDDLARPVPGRGMRASSADPNWQNGNGDCRPIEPGQTLTLAELQGPGQITHIWFTIAAQDSLYPRSMVLRMYWDGETEPSVESPIGDFFAVGHGLKAWVDSAVVEISSDGKAYNCYWRMPFRKSARLTVSNDAAVRVDCLFYYIDWIKQDSIAEKAPYFHAQYRQEYPCKAGEDYLILDATGAGHYVGTVLSVAMVEPGWFGEGDDRFFIDGETEPSLRGTGTEDYFSDAWGFRKFTQPYHGVTLWEGYDSGCRGTAYRWHLQDPVPFSRSLKVTIEHKGSRNDASGKTYTGFEERPDCFSSVAFWYQTGVAKRFATLPPASQRTLPEQYIEAESLLKTAAGKPPSAVQTQDLGGTSGGKQLFFTPQIQDPSPELTITFEWPSDMEGILFVDCTKSFDYGIYALELDGQRVKDRVDLYSPSIVQEPVSLGKKPLKKGPHTLRFIYQDSNPKSGNGRFLGVDRIGMRQLTP